MRETNLWQSLVQASRSEPVDTVILPFLDDCLNAIASLGAPFGGTEWVGITMRTQFHLSRMGVIAPKPAAGRLREWLFRRLLKQRSLSRLLSIDPTLIEFAARDQSPEFKKIQYLPDPSDVLPPVNKADARATLKVPGDCKLVLVYGALSERKGIFHLLRALNRVDCPKSVHVLLAGHSDDRVKVLLRSQPATSLIASNRLHIVEGYIPESRVPHLLYACDAMWIGYLEFYTMSNVLVLAAHHMVPCITSREGIVGYLSRRHGFGMSIDPRSEQSIVEVLQRIAYEDASVARAAETAGAAFSRHSYKEFYRVIAESVHSVDHQVMVAS